MNVQVCTGRIMLTGFIGGKENIRNNTTRNKTFHKAPTKKCTAAIGNMASNPITSKLRPLPLIVGAGPGGGTGAPVVGGDVGVIGGSELKLPNEAVLEPAVAEEA